MPQEPIGREILRVNPIVGPRPFFIPSIRRYEVNEIDQIDDILTQAADEAILLGPVPQVILVTGITTPEEAGDGYRDSFNYNIKNIIPFIAKKYVEVKITIFDFFNGIQKTINYTNALVVQAGTIRSFQKLRKENYRHQRSDPANPDDNLQEKLVDKEKDNNPMYYTSFIDKWKKKDAPAKQEYIKAFKNGELKEQSISIGDVYKYMVSVPDQSIAEFHIFSHSWPGGPVLVDTEEFFEEITITDPYSYPNGIKKTVPTDPSHYIDKDGRQSHFIQSKDFQPDLSVLDKKFTSYGFSQIWGCLAETSPKKMIAKLMNPKKTKPTVLKNARDLEPDKKIFEFYWKGDDFDEIDTAKEFHEFMNDDKKDTDQSDPEPDPKTVKSDLKSLNDIRAILNREMENTYMKKLAVTSQRNTLGALPGTGGDLDKRTNPRPHLMHVDMGTKYGDTYKVKEGKDKGKVKPINYTWQLKFYKEYMGIEFKTEDKEYDQVFGRGYGIYKP